jgi:hypothetical protein
MAGDSLLTSFINREKTPALWLVSMTAAATLEDPLVGDYFHFGIRLLTGCFFLLQSATSFRLNRRTSSKTFGMINYRDRHACVDK